MVNYLGLCGTHFLTHSPSLFLSPSILIAKAFIQIILFYFTLFRSNNKIYARLGKSKATSRKQEWEKEGSKEKEKQQEDEQKQQLEGGTKRFTYTFCYDNVNFRQENKEVGGK